MSDGAANAPAPAVPAPPATVRTYVNERPVDVPRGSPVRAAVAAFDAAQAERLAAGAMQVTDSRGLPLDADAPVYGGAIYRLVPVRAAPRAAPRAAAEPTSADPDLSA